MRNYIMALAALICSFKQVNAQSTITIKIIDAATNQPLRSASVSLKSSLLGVSDHSGLVTIKCPGKQSLSISFSGYESKDILIQDCKEGQTVSLQPTSKNLEAVEITATSNENKRILYQPSSITKLNEREINRGTGLFLNDAINSNVPGVSMQMRTVSAGQQFNIRGYGNGVRGTNGPQSNFDGQGYKVYLNNIPVTDAEGITLMDDIDFGSIGNVELLKGPAGTLYGLAIAGVVNLNTVKAPVGKTLIGQNLLVGSYGLKRITTSFQMGKEHASLLINYGYQESDGYMSHSASTKRFVNMAADFDVNAKQSVNVYFGHTNSYDQRGGELTIAQYNTGDYSGNPAYIKNNAHSQVTSFRAGIGHQYLINNNITNNTTVFGSAQATDVSSAGGWTDKNPINYGVRSTFNTRFPILNGSTISGITGLETQSQYAQTIAYTMGVNSVDPAGDNIITGIRSNQYARSGTLSYFTEWTLSLPKELSITAGIGNSNMKIELNDRIFVANKPMNYSRKYDGMLSPHIAINKVFNKVISLYGSYSKGFKAPVSSYFFIPYASGVVGTGVVNTGLVPEIGNQFEVESKGSLFADKINYQVAFFDAQFKNKMAAVAVPNASNTATLYSYIVNSGSQHNKGLEAMVRFTLIDKPLGFFHSIRPFVNLTYSDFKYENYKFQFSGTQAPVDYNGKPVAGIAKLVANAGVDITMIAGLYTNLVYNYKDPVFITLDGANRTSSYNLINGKLGIRRTLGSHFDLDAFFGLNNITGQQYYYMIFVNQLPDAYIPAPREAVYFGGINLKYSL